jgi:tetratricopeptide (TPR) repeat protein
MAEAFIQAGELADALEMLDAHLAANPGDDAARRWRAAARSRLGGTDNWRAALADWDALTDRTAADEVQRSILLMQLGDRSAAQVALARAHEREPEDERITERYINVLDTAEALALVDTLPKTWGWLKKAGDLAVKAGDHAAAVVHYTAALERLDSLAPLNSFLTNQRALLALSRANCLFALERYPEAEADYAAVIPAFPRDQWFPFLRGLAVYLGGNEAEGVQLCREAWSNAQADPPAASLILSRLRDNPRYMALARALGMIE